MTVVRLKQLLLLFAFSLLLGSTWDLATTPPAAAGSSSQLLASPNLHTPRDVHLFLTLSTQALHNSPATSRRLLQKNLPFLHLQCLLPITLSIIGPKFTPAVPRTGPPSPTINPPLLI